MMDRFMTASWGLERNLFIAGPPEPAVLARVFTGRDKEMEKAMRALLDAPRQLLLNGLFGVGKTILIHELSRRIRAANKNVLLVHEQLYSSDPNLGYVILRGLCTQLANEDTYAQQLSELYLGQKVIRKLKAQQKLEIKTGLPNFLEGTGTDAEDQEIEHSASAMPIDAAPIVKQLLGSAIENDPTRRIIVTIDDLDKRDPDGVRELLTGCRDLLHNPVCSFVFTGHPLGILRDAYSSAGGIIDREIPIHVMDRGTMQIMVARYLGAGRVKGWKFWKEPAFEEEMADEEALIPFTIKAVNEMITRSYGILRVFNIICFNILQEAASERMEKIDIKQLAACWNSCGERLRRGIRPDLRNLLDLLAEQRDPLNVDSIPDDVFDRLVVDTKDELVSKLDHALKNDLLVTNNGRDFAINTIVEPFDGEPRLWATRPEPYR